MNIQEVVIKGIYNSVRKRVPDNVELTCVGILKYNGLANRFVSISYVRDVDAGGDIGWFLDWDDQDGSTGHQDITDTDLGEIVHRFIYLVMTIHGR